MNQKTVLMCILNDSEGAETTLKSTCNVVPDRSQSTMATPTITLAAYLSLVQSRYGSTQGLRMKTTSVVLGIYSFLSNESSISMCGGYRLESPFRISRSTAERSEEPIRRMISCTIAGET